MIIGMYKKTRIAEAPDELCRAINNLTEHSCFITDNIEVLKKADIIHWHNTYKDINHPKQVIQYHSEPQRVTLNAPFQKLVISQYHATLPEYRDCIRVRNIINYNFKYYKKATFPNRLRIGFSPSKTQRINEWYNKGYPETKEIFDRLKKEFPKMEFDIISGVSLEEAILRKSKCSVIIDECMTPSYHRSALEGMALGKMTICSVSDEIQTIVKDVCGDFLPIENVKIDKLYDFLKNLNNLKLDDINKKGLENREWIETFWSQEKIIQEYLEIYGEL
jgi:hypothetical protein